MSAHSRNETDPDAQVNNNNSEQQQQEEDWWDAEDQSRPEPKPVKDEFNEAELRKAIMQIQIDTTIDRKEKARKIQYLMSHRGLSQRPKPPAAGDLPDVASAEATDGAGSLTAKTVDDPYTISYFDEEKGIMGCKHYRRKVKLEANCCKTIFPCRFCHDESCDHGIVRHETKNMLCMLCMTLQPAAKTCCKCGVDVAAYYCDKCKLWDDDPKKSIYHCDDCGICRQGKGLNDDYFHCKKCNICMVMGMKGKHRCIERNLESDCPICGEYMFTSTTTVVFMQCGHCIHKLCYSAYIQTSYQCPTCLKSLGDMSEYFARLDRELVRQPMPPEYEKYVSHIFCNDCEKKSSAKYHFFYHKCTDCGSYNTTVLKTENTEETAQDDESRNPPPSSTSTCPTQSSTSPQADEASTSNGSTTTNALEQHSTNLEMDHPMTDAQEPSSAVVGNDTVPPTSVLGNNNDVTPSFSSSSSPGSTSNNPSVPHQSASSHEHCHHHNHHHNHHHQHNNN